MDHTEMNTIDENKSSTIRKKSSFLRDSSYRIFDNTKKSKEDSDDDNNRNNVDETLDNKNNKSRKKSLKITNRNGLKQFLFLHKTNCEASSIEAKIPLSSCHETNELSQSIICNDLTSVKVLKKNKQHMPEWSKTNVVDETIAHNILIVRTDKFEPTTSRKQVFINDHPEIQASFHRRQNHFIVACGTVLIALSVIITITIYVIIMTVKHKTQMNQIYFYNHPH